jgi:hypothetical protein
MQRLEEGKVSADRFDFGYLRSHGGRFGIRALQSMAHFVGPRAHYVGAIAAAVLTQTPDREIVPPVAALGSNFTIYPKGTSLPPDFLAQDWHKDPGYSALPDCLVRARVACDAFVFDVGRGRIDVVILGRDAQGGVTTSNGLFERSADGRWELVGVPEDRWACPAILKALRQGDWALAAPPPPPGRQVVVLGQWLAVRPLQEPVAACPK